MSVLTRNDVIVDALRFENESDFVVLRDLVVRVLGVDAGFW